jgi:acetyl esterase/lipase
MGDEQARFQDVAPGGETLPAAATAATATVREPASPAPSPRRRPPVPENVERLADIEYARVGERPLLLDLYLPKQRPANQRLPLVIWVHGGAWRAGNKFPTPAAALATRGYAVASVGYRLSQEALFPAQIADCKAAVRFLRANAEKWGLDPDRFGAWGPSAGGHQVTLLGTANHVREWDKLVGGHPDVSSRVQAVCDWFGPSDITKMGTHHDAADSPESQLIGGAVQQNKEKAARANPITYVTRNAPPFLIQHGDRDNIVPFGQSELLHEALKKAGVPVTFERMAGAGHGGPAFDTPEMSDKVAAFFDKHLKRPAP